MKRKNILNRQITTLSKYSLLEKNIKRTNKNVLDNKKTKIVFKKKPIAIHILDYG